MEGEDLIDFVGQLTSLRKKFPQLTSRRWVNGKQADGSFGALWLRPDAQEMTEADWNFAEGRFLAYVLAPVHHGRHALFIVLNAAHQAIDFALPQIEQFKSWAPVLNTSCDHAGSVDFHGRRNEQHTGRAPCSASRARHERLRRSALVLHRRRRDAAAVGARRARR